MTLARLEWAVLLWHGPSAQPEAERLQYARTQLQAAQARLRQPPPENSAYDALPWQFDLGPGQDPLTLRSWAEKRCMADWLAASTKLLAGEQNMPAPHKDCGENAYAMPRAVLRLLTLPGLPGPARQNLLESGLQARGAGK